MKTSNNKRRNNRNTNSVDANNNNQPNFDIDVNNAEPNETTRRKRSTKKSNTDETINKVSKKSRAINKNTQPSNVVNENTNVNKTREQLIEKLLRQKEVNKYFSQESSHDVIKLNSKDKANTSISPKKSKKPVKKADESDLDDDDDEDEDEDDDWEEVKIDENTGTVLPKISQDTIEIKIEGNKGKKKAGFDFGAYMLRTYKNFQKKLAIEMHKAHLVCWLYHGLYLNKLTINKFINATALSLCDSFLVQFKNEIIDLDLAKKIINYFRENFIKYDCEKAGKTIDKASLLVAIQNLKCENNLEYILIVLAFLRCLNIRSRLCISFDVAQIKEETKAKKSTASSRNKKNSADQNESETEEEEEESIEDENCSISSEEKVKPVAKAVKRKSLDGGKVEKKEIKKRRSEVLVKEETNNDDEDEIKTTRNGLTRRCKSKAKYNEDDLIDKEISAHLTQDDQEFNVKKENKKKPVVRKDSKKQKEIKNEVKAEEKDIKEEEEDNKNSAINLKTAKTSLIKNNKVLSEDDEQCLNINEELSKSNEYLNYWIEIYLDKEERWISVDPIKLKYDCDTCFEKRLNQRILYVCGFDNDNKIKDVTKRYAIDWNVSTRKLRIEHFDTTFWWEKVLVKYKPIDLQLYLSEDKLLDQLLYTKPLPKTVSEYKSHPLYVLKRHLLKFQSIYPPDVEPLGKFRGENVYSTQNLVTLHSKQTWLKYARNVKENEQPYKIVKGRVKWSEYKLGVRENPDLELYGFWQTTPYVPAVAKDGKVPRNEYGNVELFQKSMLPIGCVHLQLPNLNKLCRTLGIDCAPAVVGFDAHHGFSHAVYDGWVVCEEFKDVVIDAYKEDEKQNELKLIEKQKEKIWNNWRKLIKSILVREKLKLKYGEKDDAKVSNKKGLVTNNLIKEKLSTPINCDSGTDDEKSENDQVGKNEDHEEIVKVGRNGEDSTKKNKKVINDEDEDVEENKKKSVIRRTKSRTQKKTTRKKSASDNDNEVETEIKMDEEYSNRKYTLRTKQSKPNYNVDEADNDEKTKPKTKPRKRLSNLKTMKITEPNDDKDYFPIKSNDEASEEENLQSDDYDEEFLKNKPSRKNSKKQVSKNETAMIKPVTVTNEINKDESLKLSEDEDF